MNPASAFGRQNNMNKPGGNSITHPALPRHVYLLDWPERKNIKLSRNAAHMDAGNLIIFTIKNNLNAAALENKLIH